MIFFVLTFIVAIITVAVPTVLLRLSVQRWHVNPKIFWLAGTAGIVVSLLIFGVNMNIDGSFPAFDQLPDAVQAVILGVASGLFIELGKFVVLDRMMRKVRTREAGLVFGLGWAGLSTIIMGFFLAVGVFGMQGLLNTKDLASAIPNATPDQVQFLQDSQKQVQELVSGNPLKALSPLLETANTLIFDMAMTLLILTGLNKKQTRQTWLAVGLRTVMATSLFYAAQLNSFPIEIIFAFWLIAGGALLFYLQKNFKSAAAV
jgi:uncharacterized membrane protein YhfC